MGAGRRRRLLLWRGGSGKRGLNNVSVGCACAFGGQGTEIKENSYLNSSSSWWDSLWVC